jgi:hypothetical protein
MLLLSFIIITFCSVIMVGALRTDAENNFYSQRLYSENTRNFHIIDSEDNAFWQTFLTQNSETDYILYCLTRDGEKDVRSVYYKGNVDLPPMLSGRFFSPEDCLSDRRTVVLGKDYENETQTINGVMCYTYNDQSYEVIGIMGTEKPSRINDILLLNFASGIAMETTSAPYAVDGPNPAAIDKFVSDVESAFRYPAYVTTSGVYRPAGTGLLGARQTSTLFYALIIGSFLLSTVTVAFLWIGYRRRTVSIKRMLGYTDAQIAKDTLYNYVKIALTGFVLGIAGVLALSNENRGLHIMWPDCLIGLALTVLMGLLALVLPLNRSLRTGIEEEMR